MGQHDDVVEAAPDGVQTRSAGAAEDVVLHRKGRGPAEDVDDKLVAEIPDGAVTGRNSVVVARLVGSYGNMLNTPRT